MEFWNGIKRRASAWHAAALGWAKTQVAEAPNVRPLVCFRAACTVVSLGALMQAHAGISYVNSASALNPTDFISWNRVGPDGTLVFNPTKGISTNGLRFIVAKQASGAMRIADEPLQGQHELCLNTQNGSEVSIEFEHPVSAAGAVVVLSSSTYANLTVRAYDASGALIMQTTEAHLPGSSDDAKFMGAVGNGENIKTLEYTSDYGVISLGHLGLRPFNANDTFPSDLSDYYMKSVSDRPLPVVSDQTYSVVKNSSYVSPDPNVLVGSINAEGARLAKGPEHAQSFTLYPDGSFDYVPQKDYHGHDQFLFVGTGDYGQTLSLPGKANIDVLWINSQPTFTAGPDQVSEEDAGLQTVENWAKNISAGAADEDPVQKLTWFVTDDNPELFVEQPKLSSAGTLTYTAAPHMSGTAHVTVWLKDDGGIDNGGVDVSKPAHFTITVTGVDHKPILDPLLDRTVVEGDTMEVQALGTTVDLGKSLSYSLVNAPEGMTINHLTGLIRWTPGKEDGGKSYAVTVCALSGGSSELSDSKVMIVDVMSLTAKHMIDESRALASAKPAASKPSAIKMATIRRTAAMPIAGIQKTYVAMAHKPRYWVE